MSKMQLTFLGTGTSGGVPSIGCSCEVCRSSDPRDRRLRSSALLETATTRLLIDCGPDFRQQILPLPFRRFDAILLTHIHFDHVAGIDDLRPFCVFGDLEIYTNHRTAESLRTTMPYCFTEHLYPGVPRLNLHEVQPRSPFTVGDIEVLPLEVMHDRLPILGFRFGNLAYITDMKTMADSEAALLKGIDTLVVDALRWAPDHHSHMTVDEAVAFARTIGARRTLLMHCNHQIGLHAETNRRLPSGVELAYDGMTVDIP